jgi:hypothetical protein
MNPIDILSTLNIYPIFVDDVDDADLNSPGNKHLLSLVILISLYRKPEHKNCNAVRRKMQFEITQDEFDMDKTGLEYIDNCVHLIPTINRGPEDFINCVSFSYINNDNNVVNLTIKNITLKVDQKEYPVDVENFTLFIRRLLNTKFTSHYYFTFNENIPDNARIFIDYVSTTTDATEFQKHNKTNFIMSSNGLTINDLNDIYN